MVIPFRFEPLVPPVKVRYVGQRDEIRTFRHRYIRLVQKVRIRIADLLLVLLQ